MDTLDEINQYHYLNDVPKLYTINPLVSNFHFAETQSVVFWRYFGSI